MKYCADCKHNYITNIGLSLCLRKQNFDEYKAKWEPIVLNALKERHTIAPWDWLFNRCGDRARFFEPKEGT